MTDSTLNHTIAYWNAQPTWDHGNGRFWLELPQVQRRLNQKISGSPEVDWVAYTLEHHFADRLPVGHCLSLGCGQGSLERNLARQQAFVHCDALDVAFTSVQRAKAFALQSGFTNINYRVEDANHMQLPLHRYDAVWATGAVHHFASLEQIFEQVSCALKDGGLFILNEYIGASRFQFSHRQRQVIEAALLLVPLRYRSLIEDPPSAGPGERISSSVAAGQIVHRIRGKLKDRDLLNAVKRRLVRSRARITGTPRIKATANLPTLHSVMAVDPSESIRSAEIVPVLCRYFDIVEFKPMGGAILQFLLADIAGNFQGEEGEKVLEMLFTVEDTLMAVGDLDSDFAYIVATPKTQRSSSPTPPTETTMSGNF